MAKLSIIIPIYNAEQTLGRCLDSVVNQTLRDIEIILVDDGSTDDSFSLCEEYAQRDSRIILIHKEENKGLVAARKTGIEKAPSEYVTYIDSDDWIDPDTYRELVLEMENDGSDLVIAGHYTEDEGKIEAVNGEVEAGVYSQEQIEDKLFPNLMSDGYDHGWAIFPYVWDKIFKRSILLPLQKKVPDIVRIGEDAAVTYPYLVKCKRVSVTKNCFYHYCRNNSSMLHNGADSFSDILGYRSLYLWLQDEFSQNAKAIPLIAQARNCIMNNTILPRSPMLLQNVMEWEDLFPFKNSSKYRNFVVYGAGLFGRYLCRYLKQYKQDSLKAWMDSDSEIQNRNSEVLAPEEINNIDYDCVLVAIVKKKAQMEVTSRLEDLGVAKEHILCPDMEWVSREQEKIFSFDFDIEN